MKPDTPLHAQDAASKRQLGVLLVDDSPMISERLAAILDDAAGIRVLSIAVTALAAIDAIDRSRPDLVVLDICLEDSNGWDVMQHIKKNVPDTHVLVFSNNTSAATRAKFMNAGAEGFFDKSLEFTELRNAVLKLAASDFGMKR